MKCHSWQTSPTLVCKDAMGSTSVVSCPNINSWPFYLPPCAWGSGKMHATAGFRRALTVNKGWASMTQTQTATAVKGCFGADGWELSLVALFTVQQGPLFSLPLLASDSSAKSGEGGGDRKKPSCGPSPPFSVRPGAIYLSTGMSGKLQAAGLSASASPETEVLLSPELIGL